jgi:hypothetical protein
MAAFILEAGRRTGIHFNINVGIFVPKPHTPYQRMPQLGIEEAEKRLGYIKSRLRPFGHRINVPDPLVSLIEGVLSRGDTATAEIIEEAWYSGCRLDAWQDEIKKDRWRAILAQHPEQVARIGAGWGAGEGLPWDSIASGVAGDYLSGECSRSDASVGTSSCTIKCTHPCGICGPSAAIVQNTAVLPAEDGPDTAASITENVQNSIYHQEYYHAPDDSMPGPAPARPGTWRIVFAFRKTETAVFHSHLSVVEIFSMAFMRAGIPALYSAGFNPLPRLEIVAPLSLGIASEAEIAAMDTVSFFDAAEFLSRLNRCLPQGFSLARAEHYYIPPGHKKHSLSSLLWGFEYETPGPRRITVPLGQEKEFRTSLPVSRFDLKRLAVLARDPADSAADGKSYFDVYRHVYPDAGPFTA